MGAPKKALNAATQSVGLTVKLATVLSVSADGTKAVTVDRMNTQTTVSMLVQRSKGPLPQPGETWLLTQDLGMWTFAAIVATSTGQFLAPPAAATTSSPAPSTPAAPTAGTWQAPAYAAGFGAGSGRQAPRYRLEDIGAGVVRLDGTVTTTAAKVAGSVMFTLASGYWPKQPKRFPGVANPPAYQSSVLGTTLVEVNAQGQVICIPACSASGQQVVLDGMTFPVD